MTTTYSRALSLVLCLLLVTATSFAAPKGSVDISDDLRAQLAAFDLSSGVPVDVIVKMSGEPAALVSPGARSSRLNQIRAERGNVFSHLRRNGIEVSPRHEFEEVFVGFSLTIPASQLPLLASVPGVVGIYENVAIPAPESVDESAVMNVSPELANSVPTIDAPAVWNLGYRGEGMLVGILDTGVDYTHPDLGGCLGPGCKVIGGFDFIDLDSDPQEAPTSYHGTHVAAIAAGLKGVAPEANILAVRVLGTNTSGNVSNLSNVMAGIEYAVRNGVDVINMSIGLTNAYGQSTNLWAEMTGNAVKAGVVWVNSNGNDGPVPYRANMYGSSPLVIATGNADVRGADYPRTTIVATGEALIGGSYGVAFSGGLLGTAIDVVDVGFGNTPAYYEGKDVAGKIVIALRGGAAGEDAGFVNKADQAQAAGAAAIIIYNDAAREVDFTTAALSIPSFTMSHTNGMKVIASPTIIVNNFDPGPRIANGSSRGPTFDLVIKPDVSAPGSGIVAAVPFGISSTGYAALSGTSMAAPHVAGSAALLLQANPSWTPADVKAAIMNTAGGITTPAGASYQPIDQGAGLLNVSRALAPTLKIEQPSLSFGQLLGVYGYTATQELNVTSSGLYDVAGHFVSGIGGTVTTSAPAVFTGTSTLGVTVSIAESAPAGEYQGYVIFTNPGDATDSYRVPFLFVHDIPVSDMKLSKTIARSSSNAALADEIKVTFNAGRPLAEWFLANSTGGTRFTTNQPAVDAGPVSYDWNVRSSTGGTLTGNWTFAVWYRLAGQTGFTAGPIYRIYIDNVAPVIALEEVLPSVTNQSQVVVRGAVFDTGMFTWGEVGGKVLVNGEPADLFPRAPTVVFQGAGWNSELAFDHTVTLTEGSNTIVIYAEDAAGNRSTQTFDLETLLDTIAPTITFSGAGTYTIDQTVTVSCIATDEGSGVATTTCGGTPLLSAEAWELPLGETTVSATATDVAGNTTTASAIVTVNVTHQSLIEVATTLLAGAEPVKSLIAHLEAAKTSFDRGNFASMNNQLSSFQNELRAQSGKSVSAETADLLIGFAEALKQ
jgi:minor extracellular serine protease Vpr